MVIPINDSKSQNIRKQEKKMKTRKKIKNKTVFDFVGISTNNGFAMFDLGSA